PPLAIDLGPDLKFAGVRHLVGGDDPGTDRAEGVAALALGPLSATLQLVFTLGDVVDHAIAGDVFLRVVHGDVAGLAADHDAELDLVIGFLRALRNDHIVVGAADRGGRLQEEDRLLRDRHSGFLGVQPVLEPDRYDLAHL